MFCKHCVATALAWLNSTVASLGTMPGSPTATSASFSAARTPRGSPLVMRAAAADPLLRAQLEVAGGADSRQAYDDGNLRASLTRAILIDTFVDYGGAYGYFREVDDALAESRAHRPRVAGRCNRAHRVRARTPRGVRRHGRRLRRSS
jgi:hypothetical protein